MEKFGQFMLIIIWMIFTLIFTCSIIGLFLILKDPDTGRKSTWMSLGQDLIQHFLTGSHA